MSYITRKIVKFEFFNSLFTTLLVLIALIIGRFFFVEDIRSWKFYVILLILSVVSIVATELSQYLENKSKKYFKGKKGEDFVENELKQISTIKYERNVKTSNGDLDFLVYTNHGVFGLEVKNRSGRIDVDKKTGKLTINNNRSNVLNQVKRASAEVQKQGLKNCDREVKFIQPVVVFCDNIAYVNVPNNKITSNGVVVYVIGTSQLREFFKTV